MQPGGLEILRGVRTMLAAEVLPEMTAPHLRAQVGLAIGMLDAAAAEFDDAPLAYAEERARMMALAAAALPAVRRLAPGTALVEDLAGLTSGAPTENGRSMRAIGEEFARFLDLLDRLSAFADEHAEADDAVVRALGDRVDAELNAVIARRLAWIGGGL